MNYFNMRLSQYTQDKYLRSDAKYHGAMLKIGNALFGTPTLDNVALHDVLSEDYRLFEYEDGNDYKGIPTGQAYIDEDGEIIDYQPVTLNDHPGRLRYAVNAENILISSIRLAKSPALNFEGETLDDFVISNGFYIFTVNNGWNKRFVLYLLRSKRIKSLIDNNIYRGIGISAYRVEDLLNFEIKFLSLAEQDKALTCIRPHEEAIKKLKAQIKSPQSIIDEIYAREFELSVEPLVKISKSQSLNVAWSNLSFNNSNLRFSARWNKAELIQEALLEMSDVFKPLGRYISKTRNGFSPECSEDATMYGVLGIDAISKDTVLKFDNLKYTDLPISDRETCFVENGDFFVSRGNTTDLVALASIAEIDDESERIIFPDLMIRIDLTAEIDKRFMAYVFNSFIGRLYFKYATKGKNQTMVKVSAKELNDFYVPVPPLPEQKRLVSLVQSEINKQDKVRTRIAELREKIDEIIEAVLT